MAYKIKVQDGTAAEPGVAFADDLDNGLYRIGLNNLGLSIGGAKLLDFSAGVVGMVNATALKGRNAAGSAWLELLQITAADILELGADASLAGVTLGAAGVTVTVADDAAVSGDLAVTGAATVGGTLGVTGVMTAASITMSGTLGVTNLETGPLGLKFFDGTLSARQAVGGSTGGNVALQNLLAALDTIGLITDSTT